MQSPRFVVVLITLLFAAQILTSCSSQSGNSESTNSSAANAANRQAAGPNDNAEELSMVVHLPFEAEEVAWEEKPGQKSLVAVLRFSPENATKMEAEAAKGGEPSADTLTVETWYPAELIAQGEITGESIVKGRSYPANAFLTPPYTKGKITRVENTDYFILQISS